MDAGDAYVWKRLGAIQHLDFRFKGRDVSLERALASILQSCHFDVSPTLEMRDEAGRWNDLIFQAIKATEEKSRPVGTSLKYIKDCLEEISHRLRQSIQGVVISSDFLSCEQISDWCAPIPLQMSLLVSAVQVIPVVSWLAGRNAATKISEMATEFGDLAYDVRALIVLRAIGVDFSEKAGVGCAALFLQCVLPMVPTKPGSGPGIKVIIDQPIQILPGDVGWLDLAARCMASRPSNKMARYRLDSRIPFLVHFSHSKSEEHKDSELVNTSFILVGWVRGDWVAAGLPSSGPFRYRTTDECHQDMVSKCTKLLECANFANPPSEQLIQLYEEHGPCQLAIVLRFMFIRGLPLAPNSRRGFPRGVDDFRPFFHMKYYDMVGALKSFPHKACQTSYMAGFCSCEREGPYSRSFMPVEKLELYSNRKERLRAAANHIFKWKRLERRATVGYKGVYYVGKHIYQVHASVSESRERTLQVALMEYVSAGGTRSVSESIDLGAVKVTSTNQILDDMQGQPVYYGDSWKTCVESGNEILWRLIYRIAGGYTAVKPDWSSCWATALDEQGVGVDFVPTLFLLMSAGRMGTVWSKLPYPNGALATVARVDEFAHIKFPVKKETLGGEEEKFTGKEGIVTSTEGTVWALYDLPVGGTGVPMDRCGT
ncbi:unnamed protein product [Chondrus crispus]|uniref:Uncharacterized protein n=1 Tax=Chondrus crispus TaxID=2769 RepID=R7QA12_CHOCR|nr:unnamed protein product [Chondrus crispus]CDF34603.1 unnamed protein product [Chondrus crispus]|eukprot:XP_005714422.1 unnamed protein product [Chondrus crispus]